MKVTNLPYRVFVLGSSTSSVPATRLSPLMVTTSRTMRVTMPLASLDALPFVTKALVLPLVSFLVERSPGLSVVLFCIPPASHPMRMRILRMASPPRFPARVPSLQVRRLCAPRVGATPL